jgi:hypothetical protein
MATTATGLSDERAARFMVALRKGTTPHIFGVNKRCVEAYCAIHPEYAREARPLVEANAKAARGRKGSHIRNKTHCVNGHSFAEYARVAIHKGWVTRQCRACERMRYQRGSVIKEGIIEKVAAGLAAGSPVTTFTKPGRGYLVRYDTLNRYRRENPEFNRFVTEAIKENIGKRQLLRRQRIRNAGIREEHNDYFKIRAMLPSNFPGKDDVVSDIFEALLDGSLRREDVKARVNHYVSAHHRMFPTKYAKFGNSPLVSLDEVIFDDGSMTRDDTITRGLWD